MYVIVLAPDYSASGPTPGHSALHPDGKWCYRAKNLADDPYQPGRVALWKASLYNGQDEC